MQLSEVESTTIVQSGFTLVECLLGLLFLGLLLVAPLYWLQARERMIKELEHKRERDSLRQLLQGKLTQEITKELQEGDSIRGQYSLAFNSPRTEPGEIRADCNLESHFTGLKVIRCKSGFTELSSPYFLLWY